MLISRWRANGGAEQGSLVCFHEPSWRGAAGACFMSGAVVARTSYCDWRHGDTVRRQVKSSSEEIKILRRAISHFFATHIRTLLGQSSSTRQHKATQGKHLRPSTLKASTTAYRKKGRLVSACLARLRAQPSTHPYISPSASGRDIIPPRCHRRAMSVMRAQELPAFLTQSKAGGYIKSTAYP